MIKNKKFLYFGGIVIVVLGFLATFYFLRAANSLGELNSSQVLSAIGKGALPIAMGLLLISQSKKK